MFSVGTGILSKKDFLLSISNLVDENNIVVDNKKRGYYNIPAAFDIEVSSFYQDGEKRGIMYIWQFGVWNFVTAGRTWEEFLNLLDCVKKVMQLGSGRYLMVFVHNLPYEFQFIRKRIEWEEVFLLDERKPVYARTDGIEFRCSLKLAGGKALEKVGKDLQKYRVEKAVGNLDYSKLRTPLTPLSEKELLYCENDIRVLLSYIQEKIESDGDITKLPLTNTGYVRNFCRKQCFSNRKAYSKIMQNLTLDVEEYSQLKRCFQGGFTHANAHYVGKVMEKVASHDFTSSYPAVMVLEKFPMSKAENVDNGISTDEFKELCKTHCCMFDLELWNVIPRLHQDHPISRSKCWICEGFSLDNGRIVTASHLGITITEQDWFIYKQFYFWDRAEVKNLRIYKKRYLPRNFVKAVLTLYEEKNKLKHKPEEIINYMIRKNMLNSSFGMAVTAIIREILKYMDGEYVSERPDIEKDIEKYNNNKRRFLFYPWGVWITAYARANLFSGIIALGDDYLYSDTDSLKSINTERHQKYFDTYNDLTLKKIDISSTALKIPKEMYIPDGNPIGVWDDDGLYDKFKTLGAKRYITEQEGEITLTVAGTNKKKAKDFLVATGDPFKNFDDGLTIPPESSGKLTLTYIDEETEGWVIDMNGVPYHYHELSSIHSENASYKLSLADEFVKYLKGIEDFSE